MIVIIQSRMSSKRLPGKVLMYLDSYTLIAIMIALLSLIGALMYSMYVIHTMDRTMARITNANKRMREQNRR